MVGIAIFKTMSLQTHSTKLRFFLSVLFENQNHNEVGGKDGADLFIPTNKNRPCEAIISL